MSTDYSKLKNAELENLLKERGLPHTGKKADLVARLVEHEKSSSGAAPSTTKSTAPPATKSAKPATDGTNDDEIDWDDDTAAVPTDKSATATGSTAPATAALAAGGKTRVKNPQAVPNQAAAIDPAATSDLKVGTTSSVTNGTSTAPKDKASSTPAPLATTESKQQDTFTKNLAPTALETELAKRAARAAKFGTANTDTAPPTADADADKTAARAKRFGLESSESSAKGDASTPALGRLDQALPEKRERGKKRAAETEAPLSAPASAPTASSKQAGTKDAYEDEGLKRRKKGGADAGMAAKGDAVPKWMSVEDRKKAEARKARWGGDGGVAASATASASATT